MARRRGTAIAIGHPHDATLAALNLWIAGLARENIVLVPLTDRKFPIVWEPPPRLASNVGLLKDPYPRDSEPVGFDWSSPDRVTMWTIRLLLSPYSAGGTPVIIPTTAADDFKITGEVLRQYLTPKTKGIILNSPCNPTGAVYTPAELEDLARVLLDTDLFIITDEIYEHIIYDGLKQISIATLDPAEYATNRRHASASPFRRRQRGPIG